MANDVSETVKGIQDGTLVNLIKKNAKYTTTGIVVGFITGFLIASLTGKCKLCLGIWGGVAGGSTGYLVSTKNRK